MNQEILFDVAHIKLIKSENGKLCLIIEDSELYDFVEDYLWNNYGIETDLLEENVSENAIVSALNRLDLIEVERIYKLNN